MNEEWFGITAPTRCGGSINSLAPRQIYWRMREIWMDKGPEPEIFVQCDAMLAAQCNPRVHRSGPPADLLHLFGLLAPAQGTCSGRGTCVTDWAMCGNGTTLTSATPCCSCGFGFAGATCEQLDARMCIYPYPYPYRYLFLYLNLYLYLYIYISIDHGGRRTCRGRARRGPG